MNIEDILWRNQGQVLTPELIIGITAAANTQPPVDHALINRFAPEDRFHEHGKYVFGVERLVECFDEIRQQHLDQWNEVERVRDNFNPDYETGISSELAGRRIQFTVRSEGKLVGNCACYVSKSIHTQNWKATEDTMYIAPDHRRGMLATRFFKFCEEKLRQLGVKEITVTTKVSNDVHRLWERQGYVFSDRVLSKVFED